MGRSEVVVVVLAVVGYTSIRGVLLIEADVADQ